ncbi:Tigger transposable element-derived protein 4-like 5 [Homarus americanus]|uniref:Tigger transposable element-derived protein 4-like 5 n=2 Tax=Homarus americanus TaxID=6706 RepID=A0A8J5JMJ3_HOMAM|nr:Tigger transposable element-derived protein 4-like 5 [Homarus americanus]
MEGDHIIDITMSLLSVLEFKTSYKGKDSFLLYVKTKVIFTGNPNDMVVKDDFFQNYYKFCMETELPYALSLNIAKHLKGSGFVSRRQGPNGNQRFCYVGVAWPKGIDYTTVHPGQAGRKRKLLKPEEDRKRKMKLFEKSKKKLHDTEPYILEWDWTKQALIYTKKEDESTPQAMSEGNENNNESTELVKELDSHVQAQLSVGQENSQEPTEKIPDFGTPIPGPAAQRQIKKRKSLTYAENLEVVKQIDGRKLKRAVALTYGINESTIRGIYKKKDHNVKHMELAQTKALAQACRSPHQLLMKTEQLLKRYVQKHGRRNMAVETRDLMDTAKQLYQKLARKWKVANPPAFNASKGWIENFKSRHQAEVELAAEEARHVAGRGFDETTEDDIRAMLEPVMPTAEDIMEEGRQAGRGRQTEQRRQPRSTTRRTAHVKSQEDH